MNLTATSPSTEPLAAAWGSLPAEMRVLYVVARRDTAAWLAGALRADSASRVLLDEAVGPAAGLAALGERIYDAVLIGHDPAEFDALEFVEGLRAGGAEEPILLLGAQAEAELSAYAYEAGADAYLCLQTTTTRTFLWTFARAIERHRLIAENRRLVQTERNRGQQQQSEAERLLAAQRALVEQCRASGNSRPAGKPLAEPLRRHYRELLRAHVIMGSGNLSAELAALAGELASARATSADVLALHADVVEELVRGLASRGARHVISRADLLALELLAQLVDRLRG